VAGNGKSDDSQRRMLRRAVKVFAVPWLMTLAIVGAWLLGNYVDRMFQTWPYATVVLIVFAVTGAAWKSYRIIMAVMKGESCGPGR